MQGPDPTTASASHRSDRRGANGVSLTQAAVCSRGYSCAAPPAGCRQLRCAASRGGEWSSRLRAQTRAKLATTPQSTPHASGCRGPPSGRLFTRQPHLERAPATGPARPARRRKGQWPQQPTPHPLRWWKQQKKGKHRESRKTGPAQRHCPQHKKAKKKQSEEMQTTAGALQIDTPTTSKTTMATRHNRVPGDERHGANQRGRKGSPLISAHSPHRRRRRPSHGESWCALGPQSR